MNELAANRQEAEKKAALRGLVIYFAVLSAGSAYLESKILRTGRSIGSVPGLVFTLMYMPGVASLIARIVRKEGFADISLRAGGREGGRAIRIAWVYPMVIGFVAYGLAWRTSLAEFQPPLPERFGCHGADTDVPDSG